MIDAQARRISQLNKLVEDQRKLIETLEIKIDKLEQPARYYMDLQTAVQKSDFLQSEWVRFIALARLSCVEMPGIDSPDNPHETRIQIY